MKLLTVKDIQEEFKLEVLFGEQYLNNQVKCFGVNRPGLELGAMFKYEEKEKLHCVILISTKEWKYLSSLPKQEQIKKVNFLLEMNVPAIILTETVEPSIFLECSKKYRTPILMAKDITTNLLHQKLILFLDGYFNDMVEVHASLVNIYGKGVLIIGKSGIGKSELVLDLLKLNHLFVGDDRIIIYRKMNALFAKSHKILENLIEVRGLGIIDVAKQYGYQMILKETSLDLVIELTPLEKGETYDRLGEEFESKRFCNIDVPYAKIPIAYGRNLANLLESAVAKLKISQIEDYVPAIEILNSRIKKQNEN